MNDLIRSPDPGSQLPAPYRGPRLTARDYAIALRHLVTPNWLTRLKGRWDAWQHARRMNRETLIVVQDADLRHAVRTAIERDETVGLHTREYCDIFVVGGYRILAPKLFVILGLDPAAMQKIYSEWQRPNTRDLGDVEIAAWRKRRMQAFTDILPFARIRWHERDPFGESVLLGEYIHRPPALALTFERALAECGPPIARIT